MVLEFIKFFDIFKPYEQLLAKTFYFAKPNFVEHLKVNRGLYEFYWNL